MPTTIDIPAARAAGLTSICQLQVIAALRGGPEVMTFFAADLNVSSAGITHIADKLEGLGLVERVRQPQDRRAIWLRLTAKGERIAGSVLEPQPAATP